MKHGRCKIAVAGNYLMKQVMHVVASIDFRE